MITPRTYFHVGYSVENALRKAALTYGAGNAELAALDRLVEARGELVDVARLEPLAAKAGLLWRELFPEIDTALTAMVKAVRYQSLPPPHMQGGPDCTLEELNQLYNAVQRYRGCPIVEGSHTGSFLQGSLAGTVVRCAEAAVDAGLAIDVVRHIVRPGAARVS